jgi:adenylate cyclase
MARLFITTSEGRIYGMPLLKREAFIGRSKDNDIVFPDHTVSRKHAKITWAEDGYVVTDLGSFNGTFVNDRSVQEHGLNHKDRIKIGLNEMTFLAREEWVASPPGSFILSAETDFEKGYGRIVEASVDHAPPLGSRSLLVSKLHQPSEKKTDEPASALDHAALERANKVLFVLYEISRQLNSIHDFTELLNKIMDLIFLVIDADHGFLILTGEGEADELMPVVVKSRDLHATDQKTLRASGTIINRVIRDGIALLTSNAMADSRLEHAKSVMLKQIRSAICVPLWKKDNIIGVIQLESVRLDNQFTQDDLELLKAIGSQMAMVIEQASLNKQIREEERIRDRLERFHSPQIIEMILRGGQETLDQMMEPKDLTATVLFADINGFTRLAEQLPPREVNMVLNAFFSQMTDIIFNYDGTLDKFIGDALMAVFGAPMEKKDDPERAVLAAQEMMKSLQAMMKQTDGSQRFTIRIGINTGRVVAGNIGSPKRMDYTIIGDAVNVASRLESIAEPNQILIGEETYHRVKDKFPVRSVGLRKVKGRTAEIMVHEVVWG